MSGFAMKRRVNEAERRFNCCKHGWAALNECNGDLSSTDSVKFRFMQQDVIYGIVCMSLVFGLAALVLTVLDRLPLKQNMSPAERERFLASVPHAFTLRRPGQF